MRVALASQPSISPKVQKTPCAFSRPMAPSGSPTIANPLRQRFGAETSLSLRPPFPGGHTCADFPGVRRSIRIRSNCPVLSRSLHRLPSLPSSRYPCFLLNSREIHRAIRLPRATAHTSRQPRAMRMRNLGPKAPAASLSPCRDGARGGRQRSDRFQPVVRALGLW